MFRRSWFYAVVVVGSVECGNQLSAAAGSAPEFRICWEDDTTAIASEQIRFYDWASHTLTLMPGVRTQLAKKVLAERAVSGVPFTVRVGEETIYQGVFTTCLSSKSFSTAAIVVDAQAIEPKLREDQLRISLGYPTAEFFKAKDPRNDARIRAALDEAALLCGDAESHCEWLIGAMHEMATIKPGMTRTDLLRVFQEIRGLSTRTTQEYGYRECQYIKVRVKFEPVGSPEDKLLKNPEDKIKEISVPTLEWAAVD